MFGGGFKASKLKAQLQLAGSRIKVIRIKKQNELVPKRRHIAELLRSGQEPRARIRVEDLMREESAVSAYDILELYCELLVTRMPIIENQKTCPIDLKEAVASIIFAAPRASDLPELMLARNMFALKYGKDFIVAADELRPDCGVNRMVIQKLSVRTPSAEEKLQVLQAIATEQSVDWDPSQYAKGIRDQQHEFANLGETVVHGKSGPPGQGGGIAPEPFMAPSDVEQSGMGPPPPKPGAGGGGGGGIAVAVPRNAAASQPGAIVGPAPAVAPAGAASRPAPLGAGVSVGSARVKANPEDYYPDVPVYHVPKVLEKGPMDYAPSVMYGAQPRQQAGHVQAQVPSAAEQAAHAGGWAEPQAFPLQGGEVQRGDELSHTTAFDRRRQEREEQMRAIMAAGDRAKAAADKAAKAAEDVEPTAGAVPEVDYHADLEQRFKALSVSPSSSRGAAQAATKAPVKHLPTGVTSEFPTPPQGFAGAGTFGDFVSKGGKGGGGGAAEECESLTPLPSPPRDWGSFKQPSAGPSAGGIESDILLPSPPHSWGQSPSVAARPQAALPPPPPPPPSASAFDDFLVRNADMGGDESTEALPDLNDLKARFERLRQLSAERAKVSGY